MGHMKDEMTGLAEEIRGLHDARTAFRSEIRNRVMDLRSGVRELRTGYRSARAQMARTMRSESRAFLADLRNTVADIETKALGTRQAFAADLAGALAAWAGRRTAAEKNHARKPERSRRRRSR
ncbi:MAG: hypothetical protein ACLQVA_14710 [Candidatus Brocadiia bacterium]